MKMIVSLRAARAIGRAASILPPQQASRLKCSDRPIPPSRAGSTSMAAACPVMEFAFVDRGDDAAVHTAAWHLLGKKQAMRIAGGEGEIWITLGTRFHKKFWRFNAVPPPAPGVVTWLPVDCRMPRVLTRCVDPIAVDVELLLADVERDEAFLKISSANDGAVLLDCLVAPLSSTVQMATGAQWGRASEGAGRAGQGVIFIGFACVLPQVKRQMREKLSAPEYQGIAWEGISDGPSRQNVKISTIFGYKRPRVLQ